MKKIIAVFLILTMLGTSAYAFSIETLSQLGLNVSGDEEHLVLRSEFVGNILTILNISPLTESEPVFLDVSKDDDCFGNVMAAYKAGIVRGEPGLTFRPDDPITYEEALRVFVDILKYDGYVRSGMDYVSVADMIGLTSGISYASKHYVNEANMSNLFLNAMDIPMPELTFKDGNVEYNMDGETLLQKHYDIFKGRGTVKGVGEYALEENASTGKEFVRIEDEIFATNGKDFSEYLGMKVDYLYKENDGEFTVVAMEKSRNTVVYDFKLHEIEKYEDRKIYYISDNGNDKYLKLGDNVVILYNGAAIEKFSENMFSGDNGSIKLICNENSSIDVVIINEYDDYFVDSIDIKKSVIYDQYNKDILTKQARILDLSDVDEEDIVLKNGKTISISDIGKCDVVSVLKRESGRIERVVVTQDYVEGRISAFDRDEKLAVIDGVEYKVSDNLMNNEQIKSGQMGKFYFNANGLITGVYGEKTGKWEYGYARKVWHDEETDTCQIKILTTDDQTKIFEFVEKFILDGRRDAYTIDALKEVLSDNIGFLPQLIRYTLNSEGKISGIDTVNNGIGENRDNSLANIYKKTAGVRYIAGSAGFGNRLPITAKTLIFKVPDESKAELRGIYSDDKYSITSVSDFKTDTRHDVSAYALGKSLYLPDVIVKYVVSDNVDTAAGMCIISGITDGLNKYDEAVKHIEYWHDGTKMNSAIENMSVIDGVDLKIGDVVRINLSDDGEISYIKRIYSVSDGDDDTKAFQNGVANSAIDAHASSMYTKAHVYDKESNLLFVAKKADIKNKADNGLTLNDMAAYDISSASIIIYDKDEREKVREGGVWDIKTTSSGADIGDMVILYVKYSKLMAVYVIK